MSFTELKKEVDISDTGLSKILKTLRRQRWLQKRMDDGGYLLTPAGRKVLPQAERASFLIDFKTAPIPMKDVTVNHLGLEDDDGQTLLADIAPSLTCYIAKHPDKPLILMFQHNPPEATSNPSQ